MKTEISKSAFKAKALEIMRGVEQSGEEVIITSHGKPTLVIKPFQDDGEARSPLEQLEGSVLALNDPFESVAEDDWESAE